MGLLRLLGIEKYLKKVKTYVDEKVEGMPQGSTSLTSILNKELPSINIDVNEWTSTTYTFAQLGITDEYVDRWLVLQSLNVTGGDGYKFELLNSNEFSEDHCEMHEGSLNFNYIGTEGDGRIEFDIIRKTVYISNDWE
jgi:hypothetical protein